MTASRNSLVSGVFSLPHLLCQHHTILHARILFAHAVILKASERYSIDFGVPSYIRLDLNESRALPALRVFKVSHRPQPKAQLFEHLYQAATQEQQKFE